MQPVSDTHYAFNDRLLISFEMSHDGGLSEQARLTSVSMQTILKTVAVATVLIIGSGCSLTPVFDSVYPAPEVEGRQGARIAVLRPHSSGVLGLQYANEPVKSLDLWSWAGGPPIGVGSLISGVANIRRQKGFNDNFTFDFEQMQDRTCGQLLKALTLSGYLPSTGPQVPADEKKKGPFLRKIPDEAWNDVDYVLESTISIGFVASNWGQPFRPTAWLSFRMVSEDRRVVMMDRIILNPFVLGYTDFQTPDGVIVPDPETYAFADEEAIRSSPQAALALNEAIDVLVAELPKLLHGPWFE